MHFLSRVYNCLTCCHCCVSVFPEQATVTTMFTFIYFKSQFHGDLSNRPNVLGEVFMMVAIPCLAFQLLTHTSLFFSNLVRVLTFEKLSSLGLIAMFSLYRAYKSNWSILNIAEILFSFAK